MNRTQILNSGGGVQSSAIAALIVQGVLPRLDFAVIADTGRERSTTWDYLDRFVIPALDTVGVTLCRVSKDQYASKDLYGGKNGDTLLIPAFTTRGGDIGKFPNYCSAEWKREVIRRWAVREHGVRLVVNWIGFSIDEVGRAARLQASKKNTGKWHVRYPLIEHRMSRGDCVALVKRMGWPEPPRSSCWNCPNMHMAEWRQVRDDPRDWPKVVQFDRALRSVDPDVWLTGDALPIDQVDFDDSNEVLFARDRGGCDSGFCFI